MKKLSVVLAITLVISLLLCACGVNPIIGSWTGTLDGVEVTMTFDEEGTGKMSVMGGLVTVGYTYTASNGKLTLIPDENSKDIMEFEGDIPYTIEGDKLTITNNGESLTLTKND